MAHRALRGVEAPDYEMYLMFRLAWFAYTERHSSSTSDIYYAYAHYT